MAVCLVDFVFLLFSFFFLSHLFSTLDNKISVETRHHGAYSVLRDNGLPRLVPNDSPIGNQDQIVLPELNTVAVECTVKQPHESRELFQQGNLSFMHINARSLHQSHDEIITLLTAGNHKVDFLLVSETWLDPSLLGSYQIPGYDMYHSIPKDNFTGKGSALYVQDFFSPYCQPIEGLSANQLEFQSVFVQVTCPNHPSFIVGTVYRSPSYPLAIFMPYLESTLGNISNLNKACFIGGDWNVDLFQYSEKADVKSFLDCLNSYGLFPTITVPTRTSNCPPYSQTLIDNIFCNTLDTIKQSCVSSVGIADHLAVICTSDLLKSHLRRGVSQAKKPRFNFKHIDKLKENISQRLRCFHISDDVDHGAKRLTEIIQEEIAKLSSACTSQRHIPIQPWVTPGLLRSINKRNSLLKQFLKHRTQENEQKYRAYRNVLRLSIRNAKKVYYRNQFEKNAGNPKRLWSDLLEAIKKKKFQTRPPARFDVDGESLADNSAIAESFNKYFSQVAPKLDAALGPSSIDPMSYMHVTEVPERMTFSAVSEQYIIQIVSNLKDVGAGVDGINVKMMKHLLPCILSHLTCLINSCLNNSIFPSAFKVGLITPIHKSGSKSLFSNYRPISVLPVFFKSAGNCDVQSNE